MKTRAERVRAKTAALKKYARYFNKVYHVDTHFDVAYSIFIVLSKQAWLKVSKPARGTLEPEKDWSCASGASFWNLRTCARGVVALEPGRLDGRPLSDIAGMLAHEASHAVVALCRFIHEDEMGDETRAYLIQHITAHAMRLLLEMPPKEPKCET